MPRAPRLVFPALLTILVVLGALPTPPEAAAEPEDMARWRDPALLAQHLDAACDAVERICQARFRKRPSVRVSTQAEVERILGSRDEDERGLVEATPTETRSFIAYYDPIAMEVHVVPDALATVARAYDVPEILAEDVLRVILVHEATHALDFQRFPVRWVLACCAASDERLAIEAVLEGHAQLVAEEVSREWGVEAAFQRLTRLYTGASPATVEGEGADEGSFDQEASFTYLQGHAFIRTLMTTRGRTGVEAALRDPPCETRVIDRPILWLEPTRRGQEPDLQAVLEVFRPLVTRPDWEVSKWRILGPTLPMLEDDGEGALEGYVDNHGLYAGSPDGNRYLNVFLAYCRTEADAARFVGALRRVDEGRDADPEWEKGERQEGVGAERSMPGFASRRRARGGGPDTELTLLVGREGQHVIELSTYGVPIVSRSAQDQALALAARLLRSTPATAAAVHLRGQVKEFLVARAAGAVPRARVLMRELLPTEADLRRVVRTSQAAAFAEGYDGPRLPDRSATVKNATVFSAFGEAGARTKVRAWAATTEELASGTGRAPRFPAEMLVFARVAAAPGISWIVLDLTPPDSPAPVRYTCFARLGDRFLWISDPWRALAGR